MLPTMKEEALESFKVMMEEGVPELHKRWISTIVSLVDSDSKQERVSLYNYARVIESIAVWRFNKQWVEYAIKHGEYSPPPTLIH